jgi:hypothetical protein
MGDRLLWRTDIIRLPSRSTYPRIRTSPLVFIQSNTLKCVSDEDGQALRVPTCMAVCGKLIYVRELLGYIEVVALA